MNRSLRIATIQACALALLACQGSELGPRLDLSDATSGDTDATDVADGTDGTDADPCTDPGERTVSWVFVTENGDKGDAPVTLTRSDELAVYAAMPGFQLDVRVDTGCVAAGSTVRLLIDGNPSAEGAVGGDGETATVLLPEVTIPASDDPFIVTIEVTGSGDPIVVSKQVRTEFFLCDVEIEVATDDAGCGVLIGSDAEDMQGVEVTVTHTDGVCDAATLSFTFADVGEQSLGELPFDEEGHARFFVPLAATGDDVAGTLALTATVTHPTNDELDQSASLSLEVDNVAPTVTLDEVPAVIDVTGDVDEDPSNGIQYVFSGVTDLDDGEALALFVDDVEAATTTASGGTFAFEAVTLERGTRVIRVVGTDACGNEGEATATVDVSSSAATVRIEAPTDGSVLLAVDDADDSTALVYDATFLLDVADAPDDAVISVACGDAADEPADYTVVGSVAFADAVIDGDGFIALPVAIDTDALGTDVVCVARVDEPVAVASAPVGVTLALPAPTLTLDAIAPDTCVTADSVTLTGSATGLAGRPVAVILEEAGGEVESPPVAATVTDSDLTLDVDLSSVPDGDYTVAIDATDAFGNTVSDTQAAPTTALVLDRAGPTFTMDAPDLVLDPDNDPTDADQDAETEGYQTTVEVAVTDANAAGGEVSLSVNGGPDWTLPIVGAAGTVSFTGVTLAPGDNTLVITGSDACGNEATPLTRTVELVLDVPTVTIVSPASDLLTADTTVTVTASVATSGGAPISGAAVRLLRGGVDLGLTPVDNGDGTYTFADVALIADAANVFVVEADSLGGEGVSDAVTVTQKSAVPTITITAPTSGPLSAACDASVTPDCQIDVVAATSDVEEGRTASLDVDCGAGVITHTAAVPASGTVTFPDVVIADGAECALVARVTDAAGQDATSPAVTVSVDRDGPTISITSPAGGTLFPSNDRDAATPGIQYPATAEVSGLDVGEVVTLEVAGPGGVETLSYTTTTDTRVTGTETAVFESPAGTGFVTFATGDYTLTAEATDEAGNTASTVRTVRVLAENVIVRINSPGFSAQGGCSAQNQCTVGVCYQARCHNPWGLASSRTLTVFLDGLPEGATEVRICSNDPDLPSLGATPCATPGLDGSTYYEVATFDAVEGPNLLELGSLIDDGAQTVFVEASADDDTWIASLASQTASARYRLLLVDSIAPIVSAIDFPGDVEAPTGVLNIAEQVGPGQFEVGVVSSEAGVAEIFADGVLVGGGAIDAGGDSVVVALPDEEVIEIYAVVTDLAENASVSPPDAGVVVETVAVDTIAPTLTFSSPSESPLNQSDALDIVLASDAEGATVELTDALAGSGEIMATAEVIGGQATFDHATYGLLVDGSHTLTATVVDDAGNPTNASTTPSVIVVDTTPPSGTILSPANLEVLTDGDDASDADPGFQVEVAFATSNGAVSWTISTQKGCDDQFNGCEARVMKGSGVVTNPGGEEPPVTITLATDAAVTYQKIVLRTRDAVDNVHQTEVNVVLSLTACALSFANLPDQDWWNGTYCDDGESCASADVDVQVDVIGICPQITSLELRNGAELLGTISNPDDSETFTITLTDGDVMALEARALQGGNQVASSGIQTRTADFTPPSVDFVAADVGGFMSTAEGQTATYVASMDLSTSTPGMQFNARVVVDDPNVQGGMITQVTATNGGTITLTPSNVTLPSVLGGPGPRTRDLLGMTLPDNTTYVVTVDAEDAAGNPASSSFTVVVDIARPNPVVITNTAVVSTRRPRVHVVITQPGDDGAAGGPVARYETRYSSAPITEANFDAACDGSTVFDGVTQPIPGAPGTTGIWFVIGPHRISYDDPCAWKVTVESTADPNAVRWYFAVRAVDDVGNRSALGPQSVSSLTNAQIWVPQGRITFDTTFFGGATGTFISTNGRILGDVNGDGNADLIVGYYFPGAFCVFYGPLAATTHVAATTGPNWQCFRRTVDGAALSANIGIGPIAEIAAQVDRIGDVNADGLEDFAVTAKLTAPPDAPSEGLGLIYLGRTGGVANLDLTRPDIVVRGLDVLRASSPFSGVCGAGNFDGSADGADDIVAGEPAANRLHVIRGNPTWTHAVLGTNPLIINVDAAGAGTAFGMFTINSNAPPSATGGDQIGARCQSAGDVLRTDGSTGRDDLLVQQRGDPGTVLVFPGRDYVSGTSVCVTRTVAPAAGCGDENPRVVRLVDEAAGSPQSGFGTSFQGGVDFTGDFYPDILVAHKNRSTNLTCTTPGDRTCGKSIYIFNGTRLDAARGTNHRVSVPGGQQAVYEFWTGTNGYVLRASVNEYFGAVRSVGNFDESSPSHESNDLMYGNHGGTGPSGVITFRQDHVQTPFLPGQFPFVDQRWSSATAPPGLLLPLGSWVDGGVQLTGSGKPDVVVGGGGAEVIILY